MKREEFGDISQKDMMEWALNEFTLHVLNFREIWEKYIELIKMYGNNITPLQYYNCLKNEFYGHWLSNNITSNLLAFNGNITQFEHFKEFVNILNDDINEYYK
jgi:hypothetical protein